MNQFYERGLFPSNETTLGCLVILTQQICPIANIVMPDLKLFNSAEWMAAASTAHTTMSKGEGADTFRLQPLRFHLVGARAQHTRHGETGDDPQITLEC